MEEDGPTEEDDDITAKVKGIQPKAESDCDVEQKPRWKVEHMNGNKKAKKQSDVAYLDDHSTEELERVAGRKRVSIDPGMKNLLFCACRYTD